jgi:hypothetical protein
MIFLSLFINIDYIYIYIEQCVYSKSCQNVWVIDDGLFLLPSKGGGTLACSGLIQSLACGNHDGDERLLL